MPSLTKSQQQDLITNRNRLLHAAEVDLRALVKHIHEQLLDANTAIESCGANPYSAFDAKGTSQAQVFQLLQDRLQEVGTSVSGVHRY